jgi:hypothetical protein
VRRVATFGTVVVVVASVLASCGSGGDDTLSQSARDRLAPMTARVRAALDAFDPAGAAAAVAEVKQTVERLADEGEIGDERAVTLLAAVERVERRLELAPTTTTTTTTTTAPPPPTVDDEGGKGEGEGNGNGKGRGKGED